MAKLSSLFNDAQFINAIPANGAKLFTYAAGSSAKLATYTDEDGLVAQSNPIILNSRGEPAQPIWLLEGLKYKFVFAPATDTDPPVSPIRTIDDISGINDTSITIDQWVDSGLSPTYVSATSFTVAGDQTSLFTNKRRVKSFVTAGIAYSTVLSATFGALTTVVVVNDSLPLDTGLSNIQVGLLTPDNTSIPSIIESYRATVAATATTTPLWASTAQVQGWTGTPTITDLPDAPQAGLWRICYPTAGTIFTDNENLDVQGNANYTVEAGDKIYIEALTVSTFKVFIQKQTGASLIPTPDASTTVKGIVELATTADLQTGTDTTRAVTVSAIKGAMGFTNYFQSTDQTVTFNSNLNVAHGLSAKPVFYLAFLKCTTAELGYAINEEVLMPAQDVAGVGSTTVSANATNVTISTNSGGVRVVNKSTLVATVITAGNWRWVVRAWV